LNLSSQITYQSHIFETNTIKLTSFFYSTLGKYANEILHSQTLYKCSSMRVALTHNIFKYSIVLELIQVSTRSNNEYTLKNFSFSFQISIKSFFW